MQRDRVLIDLQKDLPEGLIGFVWLLQEFVVQTWSEALGHDTADHIGLSLVYHTQYQCLKEALLQTHESARQKG